MVQLRSKDQQINIDLYISHSCIKLGVKPLALLQIKLANLKKSANWDVESLNQDKTLLVGVKTTTTLMLIWHQLLFDKPFLKLEICLRSLQILFP